MNKTLKILTIIIVALGLTYTATWYYFGSKIKDAVGITQEDIDKTGQKITLTNSKTTLKGFPKKFNVTWSGQLDAANGSLIVPAIRAKGWFVPGQALDISAPQGIEIRTKDSAPVKLDRMDLSLTVPKNWPGHAAGATRLGQWQTMQEQLDIHNFQLIFKDIGFHVMANGYVQLDRNLQPAGIFTLKLADVTYLEQKKEEVKSRLQSEETLSDRQKANLKRQYGTLSMLTSAKDLEYKIRVRNNSIFLSFLKVMSFPMIQWPEPIFANAVNTSLTAPATPASVSTPPAEAVTSGQ
tara:strand:- start:522273 stop:523157 length:885 start_codon:yes stop_codon:yes gene_type:complete